MTQSTSQKGNRVNIFSPEFKEQIAKTFSELISRIGRSENHVAKSKFHKDFQPRQKKEDVSPLTYNKKSITSTLLDEKHIVKVVLIITNCGHRKERSNDKACT